MHKPTKDWKMMGEVSSKERSKNSLLNTTDLDFEKKSDAKDYKADKSKEKEFIKLIKIRILEKKFDNFEEKVKIKEEDFFEYQSKETDLTKQEIEELYEDVINSLDKLTGINEVWCSVGKNENVFKEEVKAKKYKGRKNESLRILKKFKNVKIVK